MTFHNMFYLSFKEQLSYCIVKEMLLHSKSIAFETQKQCFYIINNMLSFSIQLGTKILKIQNKFAVQPQLPY